MLISEHTTMSQNNSYIKIFVYTCCLVWYLPADGQIVSLDPTFATIKDTITITFDATQGSKGLAGVSQVYMHAGLITNLSAPGGWRYVQGNWGQDDPRVKMTSIGNDKHTFRFYIPDFFGVPPTEEVQELAFVFRNIDGSKTGKTATGGDIFVPLYPSEHGLAIQLISPSKISVTSPGDFIPVQIQSNQSAEFYIIEASDTLYSSSDTTSITTSISSQPGDHWIRLIAISSDTSWQDSIYFTESVDLPALPVPDDQVPGIHLMNNNQIQSLLEAPGKQNVYLLGAFNNWLPSAKYQLSPDTSGNYWWASWSLDTSGDTPLFQYLVDGQLKIPDPYSTLVLDPNYDASIGPNFPDLPAYPTGKTSGIITWLRPEVPFNWHNDNYSPPAFGSLNIYELLIRDFVTDHSYASLLDSLDYLKRLGINTIELMPVAEFEGNESWGYNTDFPMALDKYYGTPEAFKAVIDGAHERGMAVILDVVFNHITGASPLAQLYWNSSKNQPATDNPWLNETARHPFNVFNDFNHESLATQRYMDRVLRYWVENFHIDGYRFDLSKGFTQNYTTNNTDMSRYDPSRVALLDRMANVLWQSNPDLMLILEHFADIEEETVLADHGFLLWNNVNGAYIQAATGYNGNLSGASYTTRDWSTPSAVSYMESHDEERMMYRVLTQGNQNNDYSLRDLPHGLRHAGLATVFFFSIPGPKMIWQFGELGYDYSINACPDGSISNDCRLANKPIRWDYLEHQDRKKLFTTYLEMMQMRHSIGAFNSNNFDLDLAQLSKQITLFGEDSTVIVIGNFAIVDRTSEAKFSHTGMWYDFVTGDSLEVTDGTMPVDLSPGEYRIWADFKWNTRSQTTSREHFSGLPLSLYPVPARTYVQIEALSDISSQAIHLINLQGQEMHCRVHQNNSGWIVEWEQALSGGIYLLMIQDKGRIWRQKLVIQP